MAADSKGLSISGMVVGIVALVGNVLPGFPSTLVAVMAVVGIVLSAMGMRRNPSGAPGHGMAVAGLVMNIVALALDVITALLLMGVVLFVAAMGAGVA